MTKLEKPQGSVFKSAAFYFPILFAIIMVIDRVITEYIMPNDLYTMRFSLTPRSFSDLEGIILYNFIHVSWGHFTGNLCFLLATSYTIIFIDRRHFWKNTLCIALMGGIGLWLIGAYHAHAGASGLIYGFGGFLAGQALFSKSETWKLWGGLNVLALGISMNLQLLWGVTAISWEGHLTGAAAGIYVSYLQRRRLNSDTSSSSKAK